ncbi:MAG: zinc-ribbon domain containing protein [Bacteroidota bacterium]
MKKIAKYITEEQRKLICPVCKTQVLLKQTRLKQVQDWLDTKWFYRGGEHMMQEIFAGRFKDWACMSCERNKRAVFPDYSKQNYGYSGPILFYISKNMTCQTCKKEFIFEATDQKFWYEDLGFNEASYPKNCFGCRRETRLQKLLHKQLAERLHAEPKTPEQLEEVAEIYIKLGITEKAELFLARAKNAKK